MGYHNTRMQPTVIKVRRIVVPRNVRIIEVLSETQLLIDLFAKQRLARQSALRSVVGRLHVRIPMNKIACSHLMTDQIIAKERCRKHSQAGDRYGQEKSSGKV